MYIKEHHLKRKRNLIPCHGPLFALGETSEWYSK